MPPLRHSPADRLPSDKFDVTESETVKWLQTQPVALQAFWEMCKPYLDYNAETRMWAGKPIDLETLDHPTSAVPRPVEKKKRAGRPNVHDHDKILTAIRSLASNETEAKKLSELHRAIAATTPINLTSLWSVVTVLVRDKSVIEIEKKNDRKRYYAAPISEVEV